jgi:hypothetical protein
LTGGGKLYRAEIYSYAMTQAQVQELYESSGLRDTTVQSGFGTPVSTAIRGGVADSELESSGWKFGTTTPRYTVATSTVRGKVIKTLACSTAGHLYRRVDSNVTPQQAAYGQWEWSFNLGASAYPYLSLVCNQTTDVNATGFNGHTFVIDRVNRNLIAQTYTNGIVVSSPFNSTPVIYSSVWYTLKITRTFANIWSIWIRGGAFTGWTLVPAVAGANPFTAANYTASVCVSLYAGPGDLASLGSADGTDGFTWKPFV